MTPSELRVAHEIVDHADRFWSNAWTGHDVECWIWHGPTRTSQYGRFRVSGVDLVAHRVAYLLEIGPIPDGLVVDHQCGRPWCVNPLHLKPMTSAENSRRRGRMTACRNGHPYTADSAYTYPNGSRYCKLCRSKTNRKYHGRDKPRVFTRSLDLKGVLPVFSGDMLDGRTSHDVAHDLGIANATARRLLSASSIATYRTESGSARRRRWFLDAALKDCEAPDA